jgi:hypothetical protein
LARPEAVDAVTVVAELQRQGRAGGVGREGRAGLHLELVVADPYEPRLTTSPSRPPPSEKRAPRSTRGLQLHGPRLLNAGRWGGLYRRRALPASAREAADTGSPDVLLRIDELAPDSPKMWSGGGGRDPTEVFATSSPVSSSVVHTAVGFVSSGRRERKARGESCIKEGISMTRMAYSILKEEMKDDECGWSYTCKCRD